MERSHDRRYEGVPGASRAARARTGVDDSEGSPAPEHVRQNAQELGGASPAREIHLADVPPN